MQLLWQSCLQYKKYLLKRKLEDCSYNIFSQDRTFQTVQLVNVLGYLAVEGDGLTAQTLGQYVVPDAPTNPQGPIDTIMSPNIFSKDVVLGKEAKGSEGTEQSEIQPDSDEEPEGPEIDFEDESPTYVYADEWCKNYYWNYVFSNRQQVIDSVLRFDITPGMIVKVDIADTSGIPEFAGNMIYGTAEKVVYAISANSNSISTSILVKYVKSQKDADLADQQGANDNPLFEKSYGTSALNKPLHNTLGNI